MAWCEAGGRRSSVVPDDGKPNRNSRGSVCSLFACHTKDGDLQWKSLCNQKVIMYLSQQVGQRRRKKRHSCGLKTVEINRGRNGYGFTISGQHPCVLSCIVGGSPADRMGLKMGDLLIAVNNRDVSQASHDDVVRLIGSSRGVLVLQIAEMFNSSESSDEDFQTRPKSKYPNRARLRGAMSKQSIDDMALYGHEKARRQDRKDPLEQARLRALSPGRELERHHQKYGRHHDMRSMGIENVDPGSGALRSMINSKLASNTDGIIRYHSPNTKHTIITREARLGLTKAQSRSSQPTSLDGAGRAISLTNRGRCLPVPLDGPAEDRMEEDSILLGDYLRVIIGYMGTVGMAGDSCSDTAQLQLIQKAIHRLKLERKMATMVLMELAANGVRLINNMGSTVAMYAMEHINYFDVDSSDHRIFVITTVHSGQLEDPADGSTDVSDSSCHVFRVSGELCSHDLHMHKVRNFGIHCTVHPDTGQCMEFPSSAVPIVRYWHQLSRERQSGCGSDDHVQYQKGVSSGKHGSHFSAHGDKSISGDPKAQLCAANNRVCVVDMSCNNSHNPESSFHWEKDQSASSSLYSTAEPNVSPILPDGRRSWLGSMLVDGAQMSDAVDRLNVRACPDPAKSQSSGSNSTTSRSRSPPRESHSSKTSQFATTQDKSTSHILSTVSSISHDVQGSQPADSKSTKLGPPAGKKSRFPKPPQHQTSSVLTTSAISVSSVSENSSSSFEATPTSTPNSLNLSTRPLPHPPTRLARSVPQQPDSDRPRSQQQQQQQQCPPLPNRQPITSRRIPKTPVKPPGIQQKAPRPKSTPPFKELHTNLPSVEDDQSGYDSDPGNILDGVTERPVTGPVGEVPGLTVIAKAPSGMQRFFENYPHLKKADRTSESKAKKSGSFRHGTDKPFRRQPLSSSHESLVISKDELNATHNGRLHAATSVTTITSKGLVVTGQSNGSVETVGRAASWAVSFDKLLQDKLGIAVFTEFLKKEFSEENIIFWKACQNFKNITDPEERKRVAKQLYDKHLSMDASEPVNVDSSCRRQVKEILASAEPNTFSTAQLQITQLMKQDSYVRFLKSDGYKACVMAEMEGKPLPCPQTSTDDTNNNNNRSSPAPPTPGDRWRKTLKKSKSSTSAADDGGGGGEEKRRRSLLPWGKNKSDKKMAKMSTDPDLRRDGHDGTSQLKGRPSLDLADLNTISKHVQGVLQEVDPKNVTAQESHKFCRVILPDSSTTVILASSGRTIHAALSELCQRRQLILDLLIVSLAGDDKPLDMSRDLSSLASRQIILDKLCMFRLDLPQRRYVCVRARPEHTVATVLKPILEKYGLVLDHNLVVHVAGTGVILKEEQSVAGLEYRQVVVQSLDDFKGKKKKEWGSYGSRRNVSSKPPMPRPRSDVYKQAKKLEDAVGHLFKDVLDTHANSLDPNSIRFDETGCWDVTKFKAEENRSSGILGFIRRNSVGEREGNKAKVKTNKAPFSQQQQQQPRTQTSVSSQNQQQAPSVRSGSKRFDADDELLFELLSRAQSRQLDDQRGLTARDLELPEFLRVKDNGEPSQSSMTSSQTATSLTDTASVYTSSHVTTESTRNTEQRTAVTEAITPVTAKFITANASFNQDGIVPTPNSGTAYFMDGSAWNANKSHISDQSFCDLGLTSNLEGQGRSYNSSMDGGERSERRQTSGVGLVAGRFQPQVPPRHNPPGRGSSQSGSSPAPASDDDLDITLIPPSDSSADDGTPLPPAPQPDRSAVVQVDEANYPPPTPLSKAPRNTSRPANLCLNGNDASQQGSSSSSSSSSSGCDCDLEMIGPVGGHHVGQSTPSPTTHDLIFDLDSGSECCTSLAPDTKSSVFSTSNHLQPNDTKLVKEPVHVSFV